MPSFTIFTNPLERLQAGDSAKVPIVLGNMENDGSVSAIGMTNLKAFLGREFSAISPDLLRSLYPGENDTLVISDSSRDLGFRCPEELWSAAMTSVGVSSVFRYTYAYLLTTVSGAVFADLQKSPGAGAWNSSEIGPLFGTFDRSTATPAEVIWSNTFQTAIANFVKNPNKSPAISWPKYIPGPSAKTFAKLAYNGNVDPDTFVDPVASNLLDAPCDALWNQFLDLTA
ncbi:hypothetical protein DFH09DRAFT_923455 [Mycena vulgaris]|nr:hypothetical protein DFH09DRAFT_923455 [Mycena vulgaris]